MKGVLLAAALLVANHAWAHEIGLETDYQLATVVRLTYAGGQPFAFEAFELFLPGKNTPEQVGRTDRQGRAIFLPGMQPEWRLKAYSADGHGVDQILNLTLANSLHACPAKPTAAPQRSLLLATGVGVLFGLFGLVQLFVQKNR